MNKRISYFVGQKFGRLIVIKRMDNDLRGNTRWLCCCDCGKNKIVLASNLKRNHTRSCGCLNKEIITKHGHSPKKTDIIRELDVIKTPHFEFDRCDTYMYFASNMLPNNPVIVEVGSIHGAHGIKLCKKFDNQLTMIAYEAGAENYASLIAGVNKGCVPIITRRAVVTGFDGIKEFFEFTEESSNSIYPRHIGEGRHLRRISKIKAVSLESIVRENNCSHIDLLFLNCEGAELGILEEVLIKPELRDKIGQLCVSFHGGRIYDNKKTLCMVQKMSEFFWVVEENNDWPCHLFVNKGLKLIGR